MALTMAPTSPVHSSRSESPTVDPNGDGDTPSDRARVYNHGNLSVHGRHDNHDTLFAHDRHDNLDTRHRFYRRSSHGSVLPQNLMMAQQEEA
jgi:hypothetical protein